MAFVDVHSCPLVFIGFHAFFSLMCIGSHCRPVMLIGFMVSIDANLFSLMLIDGHRCSSMFNSVHVCSLLLIGVHWCSLIAIRVL